MIDDRTRGAMKHCRRTRSRNKLVHIRTLRDDAPRARKEFVGATSKSRGFGLGSRPCGWGRETNYLSAFYSVGARGFASRR